MKFALRKWLAAAALPLMALAAGTAWSQSWPSQPITIIVGFPAGGDVDAMARLYAESLAARLGQRVIIENRPGASGMIAAGAVARAPADVHTLLLVPNTFAMAQHTLRTNPQTAVDVNKDFTPIIKTGRLPLLAVTAPGTGVRDLRELIANARAGAFFTYGTPGAGSPMHILGEMLNRAAGTRITHVPYRGLAPVVTDTLGGHLTIGWVTPAVAIQHVHAGRLIPLAIAERQRSRLLPAVPTLVELGYRDVVVGAWMGLLGPRGLPADVTARLNALMNEILKLPDVVTRMNALGIEPVGGEPAVLARQIAEDEERFGKLVRELGITAD